MSIYTKYVQNSGIPEGRVTKNYMKIAWEIFCVTSNSILIFMKPPHSDGPGWS